MGNEKTCGECEYYELCLQRGREDKKLQYRDQCPARTQERLLTKGLREAGEVIEEIYSGGEGVKVREVLNKINQLLKGEKD